MTETATEPYGVADVVSPSGLEIHYEAGPKRLYRIRDWGTEADWQEVPSVSTVLGVLDKPALVYWGNKIGVDGVLELVERGLLMWVDDE